MARLQDARGLSSSQRRIADCILARMGDAAFWGVEEMAEHSQSSVATVVRFAQKLGYSGFLELRQALVAQARKRDKSGERLFQAPEEAAATLLEVARRDVANIEQMVHGVNEALLQEVVRSLKSARHRVAVGRGVSAIMAGQLAYLLTQAGLPTVEGSPADFAAQASNLDAGDLLIAFSFHPYSTETLDAAAYARKKGIRILAFTDKLGAPIARLADATLPVAGENLLYSHSLAAFSVLSHGIATALAASEREEAIRRVREADRVAKPQFVKDA
ncbi:MurR/RpiR family transcriptional regulator [Mesoterricola sediminis]|uniref:MurR/RpiR family transcriptional regulator n=1 Tax=Mesoterricola sediminis TaxID=2927980 RepID=UPI001FAFB832|nr:MurR/RpiR family transcriptional regulator [Mesoterricola sediminis]